MESTLGGEKDHLQQMIGGEQNEKARLISPPTIAVYRSIYAR